MANYLVETSNSDHVYDQKDCIENAYKLLDETNLDTIEVPAEDLELLAPSKVTSAKEKLEIIKPLILRAFSSARQKTIAKCTASLSSLERTIELLNKEQDQKKTEVATCPRYKRTKSDLHNDYVNPIAQWLTIICLSIQAVFLFCSEAYLFQLYLVSAESLPIIKQSEYAPWLISLTTLSLTSVLALYSISPSWPNIKRLKLYYIIVFMSYILLGISLIMVTKEALIGGTSLTSGNSSLMQAVQNANEFDTAQNFAITLTFAQFFAVSFALALLLIRLKEAALKLLGQKLITNPMHFALTQQLAQTEQCLIKAQEAHSRLKQLLMHISLESDEFRDKCLATFEHIEHQKRTALAEQKMKLFNQFYERGE